ncbi:MAG: hypothetical protein RLY31_2404 [Bacteroidota bacterium]|jgi:putative thioredoxin
MVAFDKEVIERSQDIPVLVDFWAPWCGPCRVLGPVLEQLAEEQSDRWELVKLNTEEQPELAQEHGVSGIPNVKLFHKGKVLNEFTGALSKFQVERWLEQHLPDPDAGLLEGLQQAYKGADLEHHLRDYLNRNPDKAAARILLAKHLLLERPLEAQELLAAITVDEAEHEEAARLSVIARLLSLDPLPPSVTRAPEFLSAAREALRRDQPEEAMEKIISAVMVEKQYAGDLPRLSAIALFQWWGDDSEVTRKYRRRFDMALY